MGVQVPFHKATLIRLFRTGYLESTAPNLGVAELTNEEILKADKEGLLVGAKDFATMFGTCSNCSWRDHEHFLTSQVSRLNAERYLVEEHAKGPCTKAELSFEERIAVRDPG